MGQLPPTWSGSAALTVAMMSFLSLPAEARTQTLPGLKQDRSPAFNRQFPKASSQRLIHDNGKAG
jgi:hypothetical protein